jgi:hypothetical protein
VTTPAASFDTAPAAPPAAKAAALWEDLIDVFTSPVEVFRRRRDGRFWLPLLVYTLLAAATFYVGRPVLRPAIERQMSAQIEKMQTEGKLPAEQREAISARMRNSIDSPFAVLFAVIGLPVVTFLTALALWLVAKLFGSGATLGQSMAVTSLGGIPRAAVGLAVAAVSLALGREAGSVHGATASPAAFLGADTPILTATALSRLDLGVLWHTVLLGVGIAVMGRLARRGGESVVEGEIPQSRGLTAAAIVWLLGGLAAVGQALNS